MEYLDESCIINQTNLGDAKKRIFLFYLFITLDVEFRILSKIVIHYEYIGVTYRYVHLYYKAIAIVNYKQIIVTEQVIDNIKLE